MDDHRQILWTPSEDRILQANLTHFQSYLKKLYGGPEGPYNHLWQWSVSNLETFWDAIWNYFSIYTFQPYTKVLSDRRLPGAQWFMGAQVNYTAEVFKPKWLETDSAIISQSELRPVSALSWAELKHQTAALADYFRAQGIKPGDRIVGYLPNIPESVIALLASASIGAVWSVCSPELGASAVLDRFGQIDPVAMITVDGYQYGGRAYDRQAVIHRVLAELPSIKHVILVPYLQKKAVISRATLWADIVEAGSAPSLRCQPVDASHPLWIVYSSGTTGLPKPIVHSHAGIIAEHRKHTSLHMDLKSSDRFFWYTTTGWMMWNFLVGGLLGGSTIVLYDGHPGYPSVYALWDLVKTAGITYFGTSAAYLIHLMKSNPLYNFRGLETLRSIGSTGSPLPAEVFRWIYQTFSESIWLSSTSGGTDVCTSFVGGVPTLPVRAGEIQGRLLGVNAVAFDDNGQARTGQPGELVILDPMPSMPIYFWNDNQNHRYYASYFSAFPGVWRHGDWIQFFEDGACIVLGRSDATINRQGIRMGTSEIYRVVESLSEIQDSLVVEVGTLEKQEIWLFVVVSPGTVWSSMLAQTIQNKIVQELSPRYKPDAIFPVTEIPRTINGKKLEVPVKRILQGEPWIQVINESVLANPSSLKPFIEKSFLKER